MSSGVVLVGSGSATLPLRAYPRRAVAFGGAGQLLSAASNAGLQAGNVDWGFSAWLYLDNLSTSYGIAGKGTTLADREWQLFYSSADVLRFLVASSSGSNVGEVSATPLGSPPTATWLFVSVWHDATNQQVGIRVGSHAATTAARTGTPGTNAAAFRIGASGSVSDTMPGRVDQAAWYKSPAGGIAGRIAEIHDTLHNGGKGRRYEDLTGDQKADWGLVSFWQFDEMRGVRYDAHGTNHLTPAGGPTAALGVA